MSKADRDEYARQVKSLRIAAGHTQEQLAELAEVSRQTISNIERGGTPQIDVIVRVLRILGMDIEETRFERQTDLWLSIMGTLIEAVPPPRRAHAADSAIRTLGRAVRDENGRTADELIDDVLSEVEDARETGQVNGYALAADEREDRTPGENDGDDAGKILRPLR